MKTFSTDTRPISQSEVDIRHLHSGHPRIRAKDWRSPLVIRLLGRNKYRDGSRSIQDSFRGPDHDQPTEQMLELTWKGLRADVDQCVRTYQEPVITEFAALGLACILVTIRTKLTITEVTRRGDRADYWLGNREYLLEVSGQQQGDIDSLHIKKSQQLRTNPYGRDGYACVANFSSNRAFLWFYGAAEE